jgi:sugar/nucleoside kinase (ribokinase family)
LRAVRPLAVVGNLSRDIVEGRPPRVGGGPYYAARTLRALRRAAIIVTKLADEDRPLLRALSALGLSVAWRRARATAAFSISYDGDARTMTVDAVGEPWTVEDARWAAASIAGAEWVHVAPLFRSDFPAAALRTLARGRSLLLDGQGLVRVGRTGRLSTDAAFDPAVLAHVRVLKLAEDEARVLGLDDESDLRALGVPEILVTRGPRGSLVWFRGRLEEVPALPVVPEVDPTGAGDGFAAGYLAARSVGYEPVAAARRASRLVSALLAGRVA